MGPDTTDFTFSYFAGLCRAGQTLTISHSIFDCGSQLRPLLRWCTIGVSEIVFLNGVIDNCVLFSSIDIGARGTSMPFSTHLTNNVFIVWTSLGEQDPYQKNSTLIQAEARLFPYDCYISQCMRLTLWVWFDQLCWLQSIDISRCATLEYYTLRMLSKAYKLAPR